MILAEIGLLEIFFSMMWFFLLFMWIMLVFRVFADIFRSKDLGGGAKVGWIIFVILLPFLGVFAYLISRGQKMAEHDLADIQARDEMMKQYVRDAAGTSGSAADELARLADLRDKGVIDDAEFQRLKAKVVG